jgi:hypothetical protein
MEASLCPKTRILAEKCLGLAWQNPLSIPIAGEAVTMSFKEAQEYIGLSCEVAWRDRRGDIQTKRVFVTDVTFVPLYGLCMLTDYGEIRLDRIVSVNVVDQKAA